MSMSTSGSTMGSMPGMAGTLFASTSTSLYSSKWKPSSTSQYAGTCIFIIILATIFRALYSYRTMQEHRRRTVDLERAPIIVSGDDNKRAGNRKGVRRPWRISTDVPRASLDTVIAGVGYLL